MTASSPPLRPPYMPEGLTPEEQAEFLRIPWETDLLPGEVVVWMFGPLPKPTRRTPSTNSRARGRGIHDAEPDVASNSEH